MLGWKLLIFVLNHNLSLFSCGEIVLRNNFHLYRTYIRVIFSYLHLVRGNKVERCWQRRVVVPETVDCLVGTVSLVMSLTDIYLSWNADKFREIYNFAFAWAKEKVKPALVRLIWLQIRLEGAEYMRNFYLTSGGSTMVRLLFSYVTLIRTS
jgi:hypothetical protein